MPPKKRPAELIVAAVLLILAAVAAIVLPLLYPIQTADVTARLNASGQSGNVNIQQAMAIGRWISLGIQILGLVLALLAALGLWLRRKWGFWLGLILGILRLLPAATGVYFMATRSQTARILPNFVELCAAVLIVIFLLLGPTREAIFEQTHTP